MATLLEKIKNKTTLQGVFAKKGYAYFTSSPYDLNIIGVRRTITAENNNSFHDYLVVEYKNDEMKNCRMIFPCTTTPGKTSLNTPGNSKECAVMAPGQYRATYKIGVHKAGSPNGHQALVQDKSVTVYRDKDKDDIPESVAGTEDTGLFGINIHRTKYDEASQINGWSAGCQVLKRMQDFDMLMALCWLQVLKHPGKPNFERFTYTLIEEKDL